MKIKANTKKITLQNKDCECLQKLEHIFNWQVRKLNMHVFPALAHVPSSSYPSQLLSERIRTKYSAQAVKTKPNNIALLYNPQEKYNHYEFPQ